MDRSIRRFQAVNRQEVDNPLGKRPSPIRSKLPARIQSHELKPQAASETGRQLEIERRKFTRYVVQENGFDVLSRELKVVGKLKNISRGGLAYQYTPPDGAEAESEIVDILGKGPDPFYLQGLDCKTVYDISELAADQTFTGAEIRVRGLQYIKLTENQKRKLDFLLYNYVIGRSNNAK